MYRSLRRTALALLGTACLVSLASCASGDSAAVAATWGDEGSPGMPFLTIEEDGSFSGSDGCNRLTGTAEIDGNSIDFGEVATTLMACEDVDTWLADLATAEVSGDELEVSDVDGDVIGTLSRAS
ncbi:META domain-containing protein [Leucobacter sp. USHLN153]|uniref:META domain-containing protein n=1 Tax=Leucobacter sp. USHLN153 TaxID=3081268 RepID=UPI003017D6A7